MLKTVVVFGREVWGTYVFDDSKNEIWIGRSPDMDIIIDDTTVSRNHARIVGSQNNYIIQDAGASNGIFIGKIRVESSPITEGLEVGLGKFTLIFTIEKITAQDKVGATLKIHRKADDGAEPHEAKKTFFLSPEEVQKLQTSLKEKRLAYLQEMKNGIAGRIFKIKKNVMIIGKAVYADVKIAGFLVGTRAAFIEKRGERFFIAKGNGLRAPRVNGRKVRDKFLNEGDRISVANSEFVFHDQVG